MEYYNDLSPCCSVSSQVTEKKRSGTKLVRLVKMIIKKEVTLSYPD